MPDARIGPGGATGKRQSPGLWWPGRGEKSEEAGPADLIWIEHHAGSARIGDPGDARGAGGQGGDNRIVAGDNLAVMTALLPELEGQVPLIYLDPPFATGTRWARRSAIGSHRGVFDGPMVEQAAYGDVWPGGLAGYLEMLWPRLQIAYRLLAPTGTLFVHVGWQVNSYVRLLLDELFGSDRLLDEIVWHYQTSSGAPLATLIKNHATILHYAKGDAWTFNQIKEPWPEATLRKWQRDAEGRIYRVQSRFGKRYYIDPEGKRIDDVWEATLASRSHERTRYPTQKPEALLERIIRLASQPGDLVCDFFCGSGTTAAVADRLGRRWLACDRGVFAVQTTRRRLAQAGAGFEVFEAAGPVREWSVGRMPSGGPEVEVSLASEGGSWQVRLEGMWHPDRESWPEEARAACRHWHDAIEEWEVDWSYDGSVFRPGFAARRTRRDRSLALESPHVRLAPGRHLVRVWAIDFLGQAAAWEQELTA